MGKKKEEDVTSPTKKGSRNEKQCYNISETVISVDGKGNVFPVKLNYKENLLNQDIKRQSFEKDLINSIETNHLISMTFDHSV